MPWTATVLTLFPEMFPGPLGHSLAGKALREGLWRLDTVDIPHCARDKHRSVADRTFGGGPGLVLRPDTVAAATDGTQPPGPAIRPLRLPPSPLPPPHGPNRGQPANPAKAGTVG